MLHIDGRLKRVEEVVDRGEAAYLDEALLQEAGDSLMMKVEEAANRLAGMGVLEPDGVQWALAVANRNFLIHQYDQINRSLAWLTLAPDLPDLPAWREALTAVARGVIGDVENG